MKTIPYKFIPEYPVKVGSMYYFGSLWNGNKEEESGMEVLLSKEIEMENSIVCFDYELINENNYRNTIIKVTAIIETK